MLNINIFKMSHKIRHFEKKFKNELNACDLTRAFCFSTNYLA